MEAVMIDIREVYPYLRVHNTAEAIDFYARAFDAKESFRLTEPSGRIGHAEIKIGPTAVMRSDEYPKDNIRGPAPSAGEPQHCAYLLCRTADDIHMRDKPVTHAW
jgi:PhnB protein